MGEIASAMIEGEMCETCGAYLGGGDGYPRQCSACCQPARKARKPNPALAARRAAKTAPKPASASALFMRKADVKWLALADAGGCWITKCPTAFSRLERLGFVRLEMPDPADLVELYTEITPAGLAALKQLGD